MNHPSSSWGKYRSYETKIKHGYRTKNKDTSIRTVSKDNQHLYVGYRQVDVHNGTNRAERRRTAQERTR